MVKHNNVTPNIHMHKDYQRYIRTHFDQPGKKKRRARLRRQKAARKAPRPLYKIRPIVQCCTVKYNMRARLGRGFTPRELSKVGIKSVKYARTVGIACDTRRKNKSQEGMMRNVKRLKEYLGNLVLFPVRPQGEDRKDKEKMVAYLMASQKCKLKMAGNANFVKTPMPYEHKKGIAKLVALDEVPDYDAYGTLRSEWKQKKNHFRWRRNVLRKNRERLEALEKAAKKKAKGK